MIATRLSSFLLLGLVVASASAQVDPKLLEGLTFREIGPFRGGRSCAVSGVPGQPDHFYMGATGGGVWKSTNAGVDWVNVSDGFFRTGSVGAIEVSRSNPDTVYVGMGETEIRGNITHGDGVYRSDDAGKTWRHIGLKDTQSISRVRIHPTDSETVWVAALGHVYGPHPDRGIYKTTDGGKTWRKTLFVDNRSGAVDLCLEPGNPRVMYAATWEAWRTPYTLNSGGPGSKLFKSEDGGETWTDISRRPGLPQGILGKIGVSVSPANPKRVYVMLESEKGGLYRSDDGGATFALMNDTSGPRQRPWYYTRIYADSKDADIVYVLNVAVHKSTDGGKTLRSMQAGHSDHHDWWIDPADNTRMAAANDGGVCVSVDNGRTWTDQDFATAQFYHVSTDNAFPYRVLGAQQDNSTVRIPSRTYGRGIRAEDWTSTAGGESGYVAAKPNNPDIVFGGSYGGTMDMRDHRANIQRSIDPWPDNPMGHGAADLTHRFQWTFPIVFSPHDPNLMYVGSQYVLRSRDDGGSWERISPDLTRNDKSKMGPSGGPITRDNTSVEYYGTVFTIAESPRRSGVIWVGTDDGLVQVTQNGGRTWQNVTPPQAPEWGLISMVEASPHREGTAFVALDNHENDDLRPYIYRTDDFGKTWQAIVTGIDLEHYVRVVREDPSAQGILYAGTEAGLYVSLDNGAHWQPLKNNLPVVPIHDLVIKDDDVVIATHGRSFWILDDISAIRQMKAARADRPYLFRPRPGIPVSYGGGPPSDELGGRNPMGNLVVQYYLPANAREAKLEMKDAKGVVVATSTTLPKQAGLNRISMVPRYPSFRTFPGMLFWAAGARPIAAPPGEYQLSLTVDGTTLNSVAEWKIDPRSPATVEDMMEQYRLSVRIVDKVTEANDAIVRLRALRPKLEEAAKDAAKATSANRLIAAITEVEEAIYQTKARSGQDLLNYPIRLNNRMAALLGTVQSGPFRPTKQSYDVFDVLSRLIDAELARLKPLEAEAGRLVTP